MDDLATVGHSIVNVIKQTLRDKIVEFLGSQWQVRLLYATKSKDNFASVLYIAQLKDDETGKPKASLIVKVLPDIPFVRILQNSDKQFHNEANMFMNVIPLLVNYSGVSDMNTFSSLFPKCYYADCDAVNAMIVMENLKEQEFILADMILDYEHCQVSLEALARFHALSYNMKHKHSARFKTEVVDSFKEARYCDPNKTRTNNYMRYTSRDPINFIMKSEDMDMIAFRNKYSRFLKNIYSAFESPFDFLVKSVGPKEPLAVLCHGDFNRNNFMFRYVNNKPIQVKFLDFQTVRYANPAIDLVFMFYLNTTSELRCEHLDKLLSIYQKTLVDTLVTMNVAPKEELQELYSFKAIKEDFERHTLYGYMTIAMFNHFMLATVKELQEIEKARELEADDEKPSDDYMKIVVGLGGDEAMNRSVSIIQEMALMKYCIESD